MPKKIPYYVTSGGKPKFKRAVPADLVKLLGKKYWIRGAAQIPSGELKEQAHRFAVWTETEIRQLRAAGKLSSENTADIASSPFQLQLSDQLVEQVLVRYRAEREAARIADRSYFDTGERPTDELLAEAREDLANAIDQADGHRVETDSYAIKLLAQYGHAGSLTPVVANRHILITSLQSDPLFQRLCRLLEIENVRLAQARLDALAERRMPDSPGLVAPFVRNATQHANVQGSIALSHVTSEWMKTKPSNLSNSRKSQLELPMRILREWFGAETMIASITRQQCRELTEFLPKVPRHYAQHYKGKTIKAAAEAHRQKHGEYSDRPEEAQKIVEIIRSMFKFAKEEEWIERNPWDGIEIKRKPIKKFQEAERTYQPFPTSSLKKLIRHPIYGGTDGIPQQKTFLTHAYWAPLISMFSGMRMNEILQLEKEDIIESNPGVPVFSVTDEEAGDYEPSIFEKRLKTAHSLRRIPVHPRLVEFGFLRWVEKQPDGRLFPEATKGSGEKPSDQYSKRFATVLKSLGIWIPRRNVFHSLRNNFNDALRSGGAPQELREAINGWQLQRSMDNHYGKGHTDSRLYDAIAKADYPELDFSHLIANAKLIG